MQFIRPDRTNIAVEKSMEIQTPVEVTQIFQSACYDCHSNETRWPWYSEISPFAWVISNHVTQGRKALNFSIWEEYSLEKKDEKIVTEDSKINLEGVTIKILESAESTLYPLYCVLIAFTVSLLFRSVS